jgi:transformation/transcription domain-associated protein
MILLRNYTAFISYFKAVQLHDSVVAWGLWAEHLVQEHLDGASISSPRNVAQHAASALTALLQACRQQSESYCKKFMSNAIYCLSWDSEPVILDVLEACWDSVPPIQWVSWIPQLVNSLCRSPSQMTDENAKKRENRLQAIIRHVAKKYTQAAYLPLRTQYLSLKMDRKHCVNNQRQVNLCKLTRKSLKHYSKSD